MLQTIIVAIDGRPQDAEALALARRLGDDGAELIATNVGVFDALVPSFRDGPAEEEAAQATADAFTESRPWVESAGRTAPSVGRGLAEAAHSARADLIVVASSRRGRLGRVFVGDHIADVLRCADCPVAIAPVGYAGAGPIERILVGYDGSPAADRAVAQAVDLAGRDGGEVSVVEVVEPFVAVNALGVTDAEALSFEYDRAGRNLKHVAEVHGLQGHITTGRAAHELAEASRGSDLLCVGLHDHGLLDRMLSGSTVHALLREQSAPVLVVPAQPRPVLDDAL